MRSNEFRPQLPAPASPRVEDQDLVDRIIAEHRGRPGMLLGVLETLQEQHLHKYLPRETLEYVALRTGTPQAQVYGVAASRDDAGSADKLTLTTPDRQFTIRTVACFGQCALAPVVEVDHALPGHVNEQALMRKVEELRKHGAR